jgi:NAD(P)-dependent dehydrogenase (short-subunit alcohol dehydrogenase family)
MESEHQARLPLATMKKPLRGKVALIISDAESSSSLAEALAHLGADVAISCQQIDDEEAQEIKRIIEAENQQCHIIQAQLFDRAFAREVVRETIEVLGGLDIFIDHRHAAEEDLTLIEGASLLQQQCDPDQVIALPDVEMMSAALDQIIGLNHPDGR